MERLPRPIRDGVPRLTFRAIALLESSDMSGWSVHEWGAGGSTIFLSRRVARVVTVEHDPRWAGIVKKRLRALALNNVELKLIPPDPSSAERGGGNGQDPDDPAAFRSTKLAGDLRRYCNAVNGLYDLVLVDGRARPGCLVTGAAHIAPGGFLMLDDASRPRYERAMAAVDRLGAFQRHDLDGLAPDSAGELRRTTAWRRLQ